MSWIIDVLHRAAELVIRALNGLVEFLSEMLPLLGRIGLGLSPFLLIVVFTWSIFGRVFGVIAAVLSSLILVFGVVRLRDEPITAARYGGRTILVIVILDLVLLLLFWFSSFLHWPVTSEASPSIEPLTDSSTTNGGNLREERYLDALSTAAAGGDTLGIERACAALIGVDSESTSDGVLDVLQEYCVDLDASGYRSPQREACVACLKVVETVGDPKVCSILYDMEVKSSTFSTWARDLSVKICDP